MKQNTNVIAKDGDIFLVDTENGTMKAKNVIWSAGEYQYPSLTGFRG